MPRSPVTRQSVAMVALVLAAFGFAASRLPEPASTTIPTNVATNSAFGTENTGWFLDYGNLRRINLPSGERRLFMPMTRSRRLPETPLDAIGLAPDVRIAREQVDPIEFGRRHLVIQRGPT